MKEDQFSRKSHTVALIKQRVALIETAPFMVAECLVLIIMLGFRGTFSIRCFGWDLT